MSFTRGLLVAGALAVVSLSVCGPTASAVFPGSNGRIVAITEYYPGPCGDCDPVGQRAWLIGGPGSTASFPADDVAFSPSGSRIAYEPYRSFAIWIARPDGSKVRLLTRSGSAPEWSPRGDRIAYTGLDSLVVTEATSSEKRSLPVGGYAYDFAWAPNGEQLAFFNDDSLSVVGADGQDLQTVATPARPGYGLYTFSGLGWSASGWLSYRRDNRLFITRPGQTEARPLLRGLDRGFEYAWSADGRRVAFIRDGGLWVLAVPNGSARLIVPRAKGGDLPQWSPDGRLIAYVRGRRVFTVSARGGRPSEFGRVNDPSSRHEYIAKIDWQARPSRQNRR
jgi:dipeptidyl aminopeptidase/acylaminoacyl peptidase